MTWADTSYGLWALAGAAALVLWLDASTSHRSSRRPRVALPSSALQGLLAHQWLRVPLVLGWLWLGWHAFAR